MHLPKFKLTPLRGILLFIVFTILAGCVTLEQKERELIFRPSREEWRYGGARDNFEERWIPVATKSGDAGKIHAWWAAGPTPDAPVVLYLHGARWNLSGSASRIPRWQKLGFAVLAIDYRGFGQSTGPDDTPSEASAYEDAQVAWDYLKAATPNNRHFIVGHSLGGAVAVNLAEHNPDASGLVLEATFTSIADIISESKWGFIPVGFLLTQRFDAMQRIADVKVPILFVHGTADSIVPTHMSQELYDAARAPKKLIIVQGGTHHNLSSVAFEDYRSAIGELFGVGVNGGITAHAATPPGSGQARSLPASSRTGS